MAAADRDLQAAIAVTRFGLGARPGEIAAVRADPRGWLKQQIRRQGADQPQGPDGPLPSMRESYQIVADYKAGLKSISEASRARGRRSLATVRESGMAATQTGAPREDIRARREAIRPLRLAVASEMLSRVQLAAATTEGFRERWTLFWANHFTVSRKSVLMTASVGPFEREAIRPHVFGRFGDLVAATSRHPAMLLYLDQARSVGPQSAIGRLRKAGLNENLAREILELHTVGVDGGYTQADVTELARALTGWTMGGANAGARTYSYLYRADLHEPGPRRVMGRNYREGGDDQATAILADLAAHPSAARHLARKLAIHFVSDEPPPALVSRLEATWTRSGGDLSAVANALIEDPEAWVAPAAKLKTPYEFLVSSYRAADAVPADPNREVEVPLRTLGQRPFSAPQPDGWSDLASDWAAPDALVKRLSWSRGFARRFSPQGAPVEAARAVLGARLTSRTATALARAESRDEAFALFLMSPEFQRR
ncbi:MAG: hypothetical protein B7Y99_07545 [Caulobacterales bacterium 32-69-10]|nr:MAG: hypothetical protein B7Y99_07545 [Caulobacterales bacterium 32-69-10]